MSITNNVKYLDDRKNPFVAADGVKKETDKKQGFLFDRYESKEVTLKNITKENLKFFKNLLEPDSFSGQEHLVRPMILDELHKLGFDVEVDKKGNISAIRGKSTNYIMLNAHMDIVSHGFGSYGSSLGYNSNHGYGSHTSRSFDDGWNLFGLEKNRNEHSFFDDDIYEDDFYSEDFEDNDSRIDFIINLYESDIYRFPVEDFSVEGFTCNDCSHVCYRNRLCDEFTPNIKSRSTKSKLYKMLVSIGYCDEIKESTTLQSKTRKSKKAGHIKSKKEIAPPPEPQYEVVIDLQKGRISGRGKSRVLGGDDKCGIFISLMIAKLLPDLPLKILYTVEEETGCNGVTHFIKNNKSFFEDVRYSLTIDRKKGNHLLWSQCGTRSCDDEFASKLAFEGIRLGIPVELHDGSIADVIHIRNHVPNSVNMSAGYYEPHSSSEYISISDVDNIVGWVKGICENV